MTSCHFTSVIARHTATLLAFFALAACLPAADDSATGAAQKHTLDVPAATVENAMKQLSRQTGVDILVPTKIVRGLRSKPVKGEHTAREALDILLEGTGLVAEQDAKSGVLTVRNTTAAQGAKNGPRAGASAGASGGNAPRPIARAQPVPAPAPAAPAPDENAEVVVLPEFAVRTARDFSEEARETLGALRVNTLLIESPISVAVLTQEFMDAFMLDMEHEQLAFIPGGDAVNNWQAGGSGYTPTQLRGFATGYYRNGFRRWSSVSSVNIERVEYIKGPNAAAFGRMSPGGVVNYITKRAQRRPAHSLYATAGSYGLKHVQASATGPMARDLLGKNLYYRVDLEYRNMESNMEFFYQRTYTASASVTWQISKNTAWMIDFEHKLMTLNSGGSPVLRWEADEFPKPGTTTTVNSTVIGGRLARLSTFNGGGPDFYRHRRLSTYDTRFEHRFNPWLSLRINGQYWLGHFTHWAWSIPEYRVMSGVIQGRAPSHRDDFESSATLQTDLLASFKIGATSHKLLFSMDASSWRNGLRTWAMSSANLNALPATVRNLDPLNPDWSPFDRSLVNETTTDEIRKQEDIGFLLSERMELLRGRILLYASLRHDDFRSSRRDKVNLVSKVGALSESLFNETYGGIVHIIPGKLLFFANRSTAFYSTTTVDLGTGKLQDPPTSRGIEAGLRGEIIKDPDSKRGLNWTASLFRIDQRVPQVNPLFNDTDLDEDNYEAGIPQFLNNGIERVDGVEVAISGNFSPQLSFTMTYTTLDAYVRKYETDPDREGVRILNVPGTSVSASVRYKVTEGLLRGVSCGASMRHTGEFFSRYGKAASQVIGTDAFSSNLRLNYGEDNRIEEVVPPSTLFDVFAEYQFRAKRYRSSANYRHTIGLNIKNLGNTTWYNRSGSLNLGRQFNLRYRLNF